jgi:glucose/arabinose dehydrogenase
MKLANTFAKLATTLAIFFCLAAAVSAQSSPAKPAHKARAKKPAPSAPAAAAPAADAAPAATDAEKPAGPRRDPFLPLVTDKKEGGSMEHLPPGKAGLVITSVRVDGTVRSQEGMIAVLSNADQHVYFVREGDQLYDGNVDKIGLDGVTFRQNSKDAFGKPVERVVTKRIYASAGEQQ